MRVTSQTPDAQMPGGSPEGTGPVSDLNAHGWSPARSPLRPMIPMYVAPQVSLTLAVPSSSRKQPVRPTTHRSLPPKATRSAALPVVPSPGIHGASPLVPAEQSPLAGSTSPEARRSKYVRAASPASRKRYAPIRETGSLLMRHSTAAVARGGRSFRLGLQ